MVLRICRDFGAVFPFPDAPQRREKHCGELPSVPVLLLRIFETVIMTATFFFVAGLVCIVTSLPDLMFAVIRLNLLGAAIREQRPDEWALNAAHRYRWLIRLALGRIKLDVPGDDFARHLSGARFWMQISIFSWIAGLAALVCSGVMAWS